MKKSLLMALVIATHCPVQAMTLEGSVEKTEIIEMHSVFDSPKVDGHIGVRISHWGNIAFVHPGSPAEQAGLRKNDTVLKVDGKTRHIEDISGEPGTTVNLEVKRGFERFVVDVPRIDVHQIM